MERLLFGGQGVRSDLFQETPAAFRGSGRDKSFLKKLLTKTRHDDIIWKHSEDASDARAGVAQWQSSWFVISRLLVRLRSPAWSGLVHTEPLLSGGIPEWPKGTDCKSAGNAFCGSNPQSPIKVCSLKRSAHENRQEIAGFLHFCRTFSRKIIQNLKYRSFESPR